MIHAVHSNIMEGEIIDKMEIWSQRSLNMMWMLDQHWQFEVKSFATIWPDILENLQKHVMHQMLY